MNKDAEIEEDKQEDYIVQLKMVKEKLFAKTERGRSFLIDVRTREVLEIK